MSVLSVSRCGVYVCVCVCVCVCARARACTCTCTYGSQRNAQASLAHGRQVGTWCKLTMFQGPPFMWAGAWLKKWPLGSTPAHARTYADEKQRRTKRRARKRRTRNREAEPGACAERGVGMARRGGQDISRKSARCRNSALRRLGVGVCVLLSPPLASPSRLPAAVNGRVMLERTLAFQCSWL